MKSAVLLLFTLSGFYLAMLFSCQVSEKPEQIIPKGTYMSLEPSASPKLLLPGFINSPLNMYNGVFNPEGTAFYYTVETPGRSLIASTSMNDDGIWQEPVITSFSGSDWDYDPLYDPSGNRLYFSSQRPIVEDGQRGRTNIWFVEGNDNIWSPPVYVPLTLDGDYHSSITSTGDIYFNIWSNGDIFKAAKVDTGYQISALPASINGKSDVGDPFIAPDESYLLFRGYFEDSYGRGDLYISFNLENEWSDPINLGEPINSSAHEMTPLVSLDGRFFIFSSDRLDQDYDFSPGAQIQQIEDKATSADNGKLQIYYMNTDFISTLRKSLSD